jgi:hypothetical protein
MLTQYRSDDRVRLNSMAGSDGSYQFLDRAWRIPPRQAENSQLRPEEAIHPGFGLRETRGLR